MSISERSLALLRKHQLAVFIGCASLIPAPICVAATRTVTNCSDDKAGSLRALVKSAASGDTISMAGLTASSPYCAGGQIVLTSGAIYISKDALSLQGGVVFPITITGEQEIGTSTEDRVLTHVGGGILMLGNLNITGGKFSAGLSNARGGCVYSAGDVKLINSTVSQCEALSVVGAQGGGIYSFGYTNLFHAKLYDNVANGDGLGGAIYANGGVILDDSAIYDNVALGGGGIATRTGKVTISRSSITDNQADTGGGLLLNSNGVVTVLDSTIAGNTATTSAGGLFVNAPQAVVDNSTIAKNVVLSTSGAAAGIVAERTASGTLALNSTIVTANLRGGTESDVSGTNVTVTGSANLVRVSDLTMPNDTITACALLGTLGYRGDFTATIPLYTNSPGIDRGNNVYTPPLTTDQRIKPRTSGIAPDIGAYEVDQSDEIASLGFEGC